VAGGPRDANQGNCSVDVANSSTGRPRLTRQAGVRVHTVQTDHVAETGITQSRVQAGVHVHTVQRDHVAETGHYTVT